MLISIYDFDNYRLFLDSWILTQPHNGHGIRRSMAKAAGVSSSLISLILSGQKELSAEQAIELAEFVGLNENESDYFHLLVLFARAGSNKLQQSFAKKIKQAKERAQKLSSRVRKD